MLRTRKYGLHCQMKYLLELLTVELEKKKTSLYLHQMYTTQNLISLNMFRSHLMEPYRIKVDARSL